MAEEKATIGIRVSRPYGSEDALLENELDALSKSGIVLLGVAPRPEGQVIRFELTLQDGTSVMRAEGKVVGQKTINGEQGLSLKFTRLDSKSKAFVDRATALRAARAQRPVSSEQLPPAAPSDPSINDAPASPPAEASTAPLPAAPIPEGTQDRAGALERLRARAKTLSPDQIVGLLERGRNRGRAASG